MSITNALAIEGWMTPAELAWLAQEAQKHRVIVEIGSYLGRSTRALADNTSGIVYAVDDWQGPRAPGDIIPDRLTIFDRFVANMQGVKDKVVIVKADHGDIVECPEPDMVFIDGDHRYINVKRDIETWLARLASGGLICGHDVQFPDVARAATDVLGKYTVAPETTIWLRQK